MDKHNWKELYTPTMHWCKNCGILKVFQERVFDEEFKDYDVKIFNHYQIPGGEDKLVPYFDECPYPCIKNPRREIEWLKKELEDRTNILSSIIPLFEDAVDFAAFDVKMFSRSLVEKCRGLIHMAQSIISRDAAKEELDKLNDI